MFSMSELSPNQVNLDLTDPMVERGLGALWNYGQDVLHINPQKIISTNEKRYLELRDFHF